jgi:Fic family protein
MALKRKIPGRMVSCPEGYPAFVPNPLPPKLDWTEDLISTLSEADHLLGRLAGEGSCLPNPHLLMRPFVRREAVFSSRIEGTQTTLGELLAYEMGASVDQSPADLLEVRNYVMALEYGLNRLNKLPLSLRLVREIHARLMKGVRGHHSTPGDFRRSQNWIGPSGSTLATATYIPPPPLELSACLGAWEKFLHEPRIPPLIQIALAHYQFEAIHPFLDGNGRVGRLLIPLFLVERSVLPTPLLYLSAFFEATRKEYYANLLAVSRRGEWEAWLNYFLQGVVEQAKDVLNRAERMNKLLDGWRIAVASVQSKAALGMVDMIGANPFLTVRKAADKLDIAFTTAQRAIDKLIKLTIVQEVSQAKRDRVYCAKAILDILEEPAKRL